MKTFPEQSERCPVTAILRGITPDEMIGVCELLREAGIRLLEVPLNSPDAVESIRRAAAKYHGGDELLVGAGTVLTPEAVRDVAAAGGKFIISPDANPEVIRETKRLGLFSIPASSPRPRRSRRCGRGRTASNSSPPERSAPAM